MAKYRTALPQLTESTFLTDGGLETTLIFNQGIDLPHFASFDLLMNEDGRKVLQEYYQNYIAISKPNCKGFILEAATWRANLLSLFPFCSLLFNFRIHCIKHFNVGHHFF